MNVPTSTEWTRQAASTNGKVVIDAVYMVLSTRTRQKGTGFVIKNGAVVTNEHVARGSGAPDIVAISAYNERIDFVEVRTDPLRDLALLVPRRKLDGGLPIDTQVTPEVGTQVITWGIPLGYSGLNPLLSVGHIAAYREHVAGAIGVKHIVVNGAFNQGNSGGPLLRADGKSVIGVVSAKHAPLSDFQKSALTVLAQQKSGMIYNAIRDDGSKVQFTEAQLVADLLEGLLQLTQVMIGEAVAASELVDFANDQGVTETLT